MFFAITFFAFLSKMKPIFLPLIHVFLHPLFQLLHVGLANTGGSEIATLLPKGEWKSSDGTCLESGTECTLLRVTAGSLKVFPSKFCIPSTLCR